MGKSDAVLGFLEAFVKTYPKEIGKSIKRSYRSLKKELKKTNKAKIDKTAEIGSSQQEKMNVSPKTEGERRSKLLSKLKNVLRLKSKRQMLEELNKDDNGSAFQQQELVVQSTKTSSVKKDDNISNHEASAATNVLIGVVETKSIGIDKFTAGVSCDPHLEHSETDTSVSTSGGEEPQPPRLHLNQDHSGYVSREERLVRNGMFGFNSAEDAVDCIRESEPLSDGAKFSHSAEGIFGRDVSTSQLSDGDIIDPGSAAYDLVDQ
ncbi:hypothetical protein BKA69DRAFT_767487 [Paraphysoderma sedebokerense]|nr:hypothetical protein BKA69DRAFT_767487 [Paraphysoderma sedebokerense]